MAVMQRLQETLKETRKVIICKLIHQPSIELTKFKLSSNMLACYYKHGMHSNPDDVVPTILMWLSMRNLCIARVVCR